MSIGTALLFGVGPAMALCFTNVQEVLKEGGRSVSASRRVLMTGRAMVPLQVALTIVLLAGAGLMFKSVWQMTTLPGRLRARSDPDDARGFPRSAVPRAAGAPRLRGGVAREGEDAARRPRRRDHDRPRIDDAGAQGRRGDPPPENRDARGAPVSSISAGFGPMLGMSLVERPLVRRDRTAWGRC